MLKSDVMEYLSGISDNEVALELLNKVKNMQEDEFLKILEQKGINSIEDVKKFVDEQRVNNKEKTTQENQKFDELNDIVSYGITKNTLHIHLVPKDAKSLLTKDGLKIAEAKLIDALNKINLLLEQAERQNIDCVYAVSGIMKGPIAKMFKNLGFDVRIEKSENAKNDAELGKFYGIFKDKKHIGRAAIGREKFMSEEYKNLLEERKKELGIKEEVQPVSSEKFLSELKDRIYSENEIAVNEKNTLDENKEIKKVEEKNIQNI